MRPTKAIRTKFLPCTNTKPSRIKASIPGYSFTVSRDAYDDSEEAHLAAATGLAAKLGWLGTPVCGVYGNDCYWVFV